MNLYISLYSIVPYICGVSCGYLNINNYEVYIEYEEDEVYENPSFIALPYIDSLTYRNLKNEFLNKYFPRKSKMFTKMNDDEFEDYFHIMINDNLLTDDWYKYEDDFKIKILKNWCDEHNIQYTLKKQNSDEVLL